MKPLKYRPRTDHLAHGSHGKRLAMFFRLFLADVQQNLTRDNKWKDNHVDDSLREQANKQNKQQSLTIRVPKLVFYKHAKLDEGLVEGVADVVDALVHHDLCAALNALDVLDLALDGEHRLVVGVVDAVPHAEVASVLSHHDVAGGHPLHIGAILLLVPEEQVGCAGVELQPVDPRVVVDGGQGDARHEVDDPDGLQIDQVGDLLVLLDDAALLVEPHADEVWAHVLCAARAEHLVAAVLDQSDLPGVVDHAHLHSPQ
eukprot:scaffold21211_cov40-Prasinocladus_malaysianus.AAC.1